MYLSVCGGLLFLGMVLAETHNDTKLHYDVNLEGQTASEDVELHYKEQYAKIESPAVGDRKPVTIIHHYAENLTQYRQADECFMLNGFNGFSNLMDDWFTLGDEIEIPDKEDLTMYNFTAAPYYIHSKNLPTVMQEGCSGIYAAVLMNTMEGEAAFKQAETMDTPYVGEVIAPAKQGKLRRRKRWLDWLITFIVIGIVLLIGLIGVITNG